MVYIANSNDLHVFLAIFNKESSGETDGCDYDFGRSYCRYGRNNIDIDADFDSSDEDFSHGKSYHVNKLISIEGDNILNISSLSVNFDVEVIPEDCFKNVEPYRKTAEPTGNVEIEVNEYYRIVVQRFYFGRSNFIG